MSTVQCIKCDKETAHNVLHSVTQKHQDSPTPEELAEAKKNPDFEELQEALYRNWSSRHELIQCADCESVSYREVTIEDDLGGKESSVLYPPRA